MGKYYKKIFISLLIIISNFTILTICFADSFYPHSQDFLEILLSFLPSPLNVFLVILILFSVNFIINLVFVWLICNFYLQFRNLKKILIGSAMATLIGLFIDFVSFLPANIMPWTYEYSDAIFIFSVFIISFILLSLMYKFIFYKILKVENNKKIFVSSIILAFLTTPMWAIEIAEKIWWLRLFD